jgi:hypothetical protein
MNKAAEEALAALDKLMGHFGARAEDAPDVQAYKAAVTEGLTCLGQDMQALDKAHQDFQGATLYEHYKGGRYDYLGPVIQEQDGTQLALYRSVTTKTMFVRPASEFFGDVIVEGVSVPRFRML